MSKPENTNPTEDPSSSTPSNKGSTKNQKVEYAARSESRLQTPRLSCCKGRVADITGSGMRMLVSPKDLPEIGDVQEYTFSDGEQELTVSGTIKWVRKGTAFTRRSEVGVEFCSLDPAVRDAMIKLAVQGKIGPMRDHGIQVQYPDLYKMLGVTPYASQDELDQAYRQEAKTLHPDRNNSEYAAENFDQLRKAYLLLSDQELRARYDERFLKSNSITQRAA